MTQEEYREAAANVVYLASCMVNDEKPETERVSGMNLEKLYQAADRHQLTGITGYALEAAGIRDPAFIQAKGKAIRKIILFDAEREAVLDQLEKAGIWYMPLKGCLLKDYYPKIGMRQMADNDILFDSGRSPDVRRIMESLGFKIVKQGKTYGHDQYFKAPVCNFEMHRALFQPLPNEVFFRYYQNHLKEKMIKDEDSKYGRHLSPEDFYIYMIVHEYKHYSKGGTGLRSLLDTYVYVRKEQLDMAYVHEEMEKLGIQDFEEASRVFALHLFDGEKLSDREQEMLEYVLASGTYGTMANSVRKNLREKGRKGYFLFRLFPPYKMMVKIFPVLAKAPVLYPFCWIYRLIRGIILKPREILYQLKALLIWKEQQDDHRKNKE